MVPVAASGNTSWVCDPILVSCALEQPEMLRSHDYKHSNVMHNFSWHPLYVCKEDLDNILGFILSFSLEQVDW